MCATSPLRNAGVFEALLRLSCMTCPLGVHGGRSTWKTAHRSRKSNNNAALYPRGRGSFLQFLRERAIERRDTLCRVLKVACEQWWSVAASAGSSSMSASTTLCNRFCGSVSVWVAFLAFSATRNPSWELGPALAGLFRASVFLCCATNAAAWRCQSGLADIPPAWRDGKSEEA